MTAGERWTRELLGELRAGGYAPAAWHRFFARSFSRAAETRARRTREHTQLLAFGMLASAGWAVVALTGRPWLAVAGWAWLTVLLLMADWHLGMLEDDEGRPLRGLGAANLVTRLRGALPPALTLAPAGAFLPLVLAAGVCDAVDGPLARGLGQESRLGRFLDPGVDAFVFAGAAIGAARLGLLPWWAAGLVLARHALQWVGLALAYGAGVEVAVPRAVLPWKLPGPVVFSGLVLAGTHVAAGAALVAAGALAGIATSTASALRSERPQLTAG